MKNSKETRLYTDEPSSLAQDTAKTEGWQEIATHIASLRMSVLDRVAGIFSGGKPKNYDNLLREAHAECASRIQHILSAQEKGGTDQEEIIPPNVMRVKKEERLRKSFIEAREILQTPAGRLKGINALDALYRAARDNEERNIITSLGGPLLHSVVTQMFDAGERVIGVKMIEKMLYMGWPPIHTWTDIKGRIMNDPRTKNILRYEIVANVDMPRFFSLFSAALMKAGFAELILDSRAEVEDYACKRLSDILGDTFFGRFFPSTREFERMQKEYSRYGILTRHYDVAEIVPYYLAQPFAQALSETRSGMQSSPAIEEYKRRRALVEQSDVDVRNADMGEHPVLKKAAGEYIVTTHAKPPFDTRQRNSYGAEVTQLVNAGIADRKFFDSLSEMAFYLNPDE